METQKEPKPHNRHGRCGRKKKPIKEKKHRVSASVSYDSYAFISRFKNTSEAVDKAILEMIERYGY